MLGKKELSASSPEDQDSMLRSRKMSLLQIYLPSDIAIPSISAIGSLECVQFIDLNASKTPLERAFVSELKLLEDSEVRLCALVEEARKVGAYPKKGRQLSLEEAEAITDAVVFSTSLSSPQSPQHRPSSSCPAGTLTPGSPTGIPHSIEDLASQLEQLESRMLQMNTSSRDLLCRQRELVARTAVLRETAILFEDMRAEPGSPGPLREPQQADQAAPEHLDLEAASSLGSSAVLGFVAGVIPRSKAPTLQAILWRAMRGHLYMRMTELYDTACGEEMLSFSEDGEENGDEEREHAQEEDSNVFLVSAHGPASQAKVRKLAISLGAFLVPLDVSPKQRHSEAFEAAAQLEELLSVLRSTRQTRRKMLSTLVPLFPVWKAFILKEKAIYSVLNRLSSTSDEKSGSPYFVGEAWVPSALVGQLRGALERARARANAPVAAMCSEMALVGGRRGTPPFSPPTAFATTKFTSPFQAIVDAYGVPSYGEINPALFTIITFPFLFGVMFGDFGHSIFILLPALLLILWEKRLNSRPPGGGSSELWQYVFGGRYMLLLMGLFGMYMGIIYNDCFSKSLNLFASSFAVNGTDVSFSGRVYPFGIDRAWIGATNSISFLNAYKMKQAVLLGMSQMIFGLGVGAWNCWAKGDALSLFGVVVPQMLFLGCSFGYLCFLFLLKWMVQGGGGGPAPSLLPLFVDMFLNPGKAPEEPFFAGQGVLQMLLLAVTALCVPVMLLSRPVALALRQRRSPAHLSSPASTTATVDKDDAGSMVSLEAAGGSGIGVLSSSDPLLVPGNGSAADEAEEEASLADELVHSVIHTIEFVLGTISNTASYLRLWALSLAHSQLSEVVWDLVAERAALGPLAAVFVFPCWFGLSLGLLVCMEGMSAFLHALRLHWVEFNNKFYDGNGIPFEPLSFSSLMAPAILTRFSPENPL